MGLLVVKYPSVVCGVVGIVLCILFLALDILQVLHGETTICFLLPRAIVTQVGTMVSFPLLALPLAIVLA